jgi:hypothetical protein
VSFSRPGLGSLAGRERDSELRSGYFVQPAVDGVMIMARGGQLRVCDLDSSFGVAN